MNTKGMNSRRWSLRGLSAVKRLGLGIRNILKPTRQRELIQTAMKQSEERYRLLVEYQNDLIVKFDSEFRLLFVSPNYCRTFGKTEDELIGKKFFSFIHQEDHDRVKKSLEFLFIEPHTCLHEEREKTTDGWRWFGWSSRSILDKNGNVIEIIAVGRDITRQKEAEKALQLSKKEWESTFDAISDWVILMDAKTHRIVRTNRAGEDFTGLPSRNIVGHTCCELIHGGKEPLPNCPARKMLHSQQRESEELRLSENGQWVSIVVDPVMDEEGIITSVVHIVRDITEHKQAEKALQERTFELLKRVKELDCLYGIANLIQKPGLSIEEILQGTIDIIPPAWQYPDITCARIILDGNEYRTENFKETAWKQACDIVVFGKRKGNLAVCYLEEKPGIDEDPFLKEERNLINAIADTLGKTIERKIAEEERAKLETKLSQIQRIEAMGTLAGGIAHDFNNILSVIIGNIELAINDAAKNTGLHRNLRQVLKAGNRARDLVQQILAFSRQDKQELKHLQVNPIAKETIRLLSACLPSTIDIRQDIRSDSVVFADSTQIHQVIMNLCTNADYAMREKGGILEIKLEDVKLDPDFAVKHPGIKPGSFLKLTVSDTGCGMAPGVLNRVFEPLFTTKKGSEGTGMGLSVVHGIVKSYGGTITVYSEPGKGSTFNVFLPISKGAAAKQAVSREPLPIGTERILFIDDQLPLVEMGKQMFESLGYEVVTRTGSIEALELFKRQPGRFDLVITDLTMPKLTGDQLAKKIIRIRPDIPIILCTGFSPTINKKEAKDMGIREFVLKPLLKKDIAVIIRKVLDEC